MNTNSAYSYIAVGNWYQKSNELISQLNKIASKYDISYFQFNFLLKLLEADCSTPKKIAHELSISLTSSSRTLSLLQKKNLILKHRSSEDQRIVNLEITPEGAVIVANMKQDIKKLVTNDSLPMIIH